MDNLFLGKLRIAFNILKQNSNNQVGPHKTFKKTIFDNSLKEK